MDLRLVALADTLDKARIEANAHEATAFYIYRDISNALQGLLVLLVDDRADDVYNALLDGSTVAEALAHFA